MDDQTQENVQEDAQLENITEVATEAEASDEVKESADTSKTKSEMTSGEQKPSKEISKSLQSIIESIEKLSVIELADLVHALEDRFGISASAPIANVATAPTVSGGNSEPSEEQTSFNVILTNAGANKIGVIKAVREILPTLGLKEAKELVEAAPKPVIEGVNKDTANEAKEKLVAAGATVELQ